MNISIIDTYFLNSMDFVFIIIYGVTVTMGLAINADGNC